MLIACADCLCRLRPIALQSKEVPTPSATICKNLKTDNNVSLIYHPGKLCPGKMLPGRLAPNPPLFPSVGTWLCRAGKSWAILFISGSVSREKIRSRSTNTVPVWSRTPGIPSQGAAGLDRVTSWLIPDGDPRNCEAKTWPSCLQILFCSAR